MFLRHLVRRETTHSELQRRSFHAYRLKLKLYLIFLQVFPQNPNCDRIGLLHC